jgi:hypothetical protein
MSGLYDDDLYQNKKLYECTCFTEGLIIDGSDVEDDTIYISKWHREGSQESFWYRLKMAWHFLWNGYVREMGILLSSKQAKEFGEDLVKESEKLKK